MENSDHRLIRAATLDDEREFLELWSDYLGEREKEGSVILATTEAIGAFLAIWRSVVSGAVDGVSLIVPGAAVSLWGPEVPFPVAGGRCMTGQGTYVRPEYRGSGLGSAMYARGFEILRARGYRQFMGSVDAGNALGERNAERLKSRVVQVTRLVEL